MSDKKLVHHSLEESPIPLFKAFKCAFNGVKHAVFTQRNFKIHIVVALLAIIMSFVFKLETAEFAFVVICIFLVFAFELINTAIESIVDLASPEWSLLAKHAKDCAAGAVLLVSVMSVIVAGLIFFPKIIILAGIIS